MNRRFRQGNRSATIPATASPSTLNLQCIICDVDQMSLRQVLKWPALALCRQAVHDPEKKICIALTAGRRRCSRKQHITQTYVVCGGKAHAKSNASDIITCQIDQTAMKNRNLVETG